MSNQKAWADERAAYGQRPYGEECDYSRCHSVETVGGIGERWRFCAEHMKPEYHPPKTRLTLDDRPPTEEDTP